jgi:predicted amidophosphoribosyltransferase
MIKPAPLSKQRFKERGYHQMALRADPLSMQLDVPYSPDPLNRIKQSRSQASLSAIDRRANVDGAVLTDPRITAGKSILLMDDGSTIRSTIIAAASALKESGYRRYLL